MKIQPVAPVQKIRPQQNKIGAMSIKTQYQEDIEMQAIEEAMLGVGLIAEAIIIGCIFALIAYWVSPWIVVSMLAMIGLLICWIKIRQEG